MEDELQINLVTLLHYIKKKWRSIVPLMLMGAILANL